MRTLDSQEQQPQPHSHHGDAAAWLILPRQAQHQHHGLCIARFHLPQPHEGAGPLVVFKPLSVVVCHGEMYPLLNSFLNK